MHPGPRDAIHAAVADTWFPPACAHPWQPLRSQIVNAVLTIGLLVLTMFAYEHGSVGPNQGEPAPQPRSSCWHA